MEGFQLLEELKDKYSEHLEHAGEFAPDLLNRMLANLLAKEKELNSYYKKRLSFYENKGITNARI